MVCTTLAINVPPDSITRSAEDDFEALQDWMSSRETLCLPLHDVEQGQLQRALEMNRKLLQEHINRRGHGDSGPKLTVTKGAADALTLERGRVRGRQIRSIFGEVDARRRVYACPGFSSVYPLDEQLALFGRSHSYGVQRWTVLAAVQGPFHEAVAAVRERTGLTLSKRSAEQMVVEAAQDFDFFYQQRKPMPPELSGPIVVCAVDCKGIPMKKPEPVQQKFKKKKGEKANKKRMATVAAVFTQEPRIRTSEDVVKSLFRTPLSPVAQVPASGRVGKRRLRPQNKRVWASLRKGKDAVIQEAAEEVERRDPHKTKERVTLTDGERALQIRTRRLVPGATPILDLLHALQYLWAVACAFFGEKSPEIAGWMKKQALRILQGNVSRVIQGIRQSATKRKLVGNKKKAIDVATRYFHRNRFFMRYNEYLEKGLPIASGSVEGACKNLINDRMERSGMRWVEASAEAMLKMRAIYLSGDFEAYWLYHFTKERERYLEGRGQPVT